MRKKRKSRWQIRAERAEKDVEAYRYEVSRALALLARVETANVGSEELKTASVAWLIYSLSGADRYDLRCDQ